MPVYYRIQPAGLSLNHRSKASDDLVARGLHVFRYASDTLNTDVAHDAYGDEVVVLRAPHHWSNEDVEGVEVRGDRSVVLARGQSRAVTTSPRTSCGASAGRMTRLCWLRSPSLHGDDCVNCAHSNE